MDNPIRGLRMFTVIVPNYNHGQYLKQRLDSVLAQRNCDFELIILDDASTDNSKAIIELYLQPTPVTGVINKSTAAHLSRQWDLAISKAQGEWIGSPSDDYAEPEFRPGKRLNACRQTRRLCAYYCDSQVICRERIRAGRTILHRKNDLFKTSKWSQSYVADGWAEIKMPQIRLYH